MVFVQECLKLFVIENSKYGLDNQELGQSAMSFSSYIYSHTLNPLQPIDLIFELYKNDQITNKLYSTTRTYFF